MCALANVTRIGGYLNLTGNVGGALNENPSVLAAGPFFNVTFENALLPSTGSHFGETRIVVSEREVARSISPYVRRADFPDLRLINGQPSKVVLEGGNWLEVVLEAPGAA